jgi:hypothetical protein
MLSDDTYRTRLAAAVRDLEAWAAETAGDARIERFATPQGWRMVVAPDAPNACPFELLIRRDQRYDLAIAAETYEDQAIESLDFFRPLVEAIAAGRVIVRRRHSAATSTLLSIETLITFADGSLWRGVRESELGHPESESIVCDHHFVPYRRV